MKIISLDIDGVISTQKSHYALDKDACDLLGKIIDVEKPREFDPFGQTGLPPLATI